MEFKTIVQHLGICDHPFCKKNVWNKDKIMHFQRRQSYCRMQMLEVTIIGRLSQALGEVCHRLVDVFLLSLIHI